jgi:hypothetical protein
VNKCSAKLNSKFQALVNRKVKLINACVTTVTKCMVLPTQAEQDACIATKATAMKKPCSTQALNPSDPLSKLGKALLAFKTAIDGACQPSDQGGAPTHSTFAELVHAVPGSSPNANLIRGGLAAHQIQCARFGFTDATTAWNGATGLRDCLAREAGDQADHDIQASNGRAFAALQRVNMAALSDPVPIGNISLKADIDFRVTLNGGTVAQSAIEVTGFSSDFIAKAGGLDANGIAAFTIDPGDAHYTSTTANSPIDAGVSRICLTQASQAFGVLCCNPAGCTGVLGSPNYTFDIEHDSSGNNTGTGYLGTGVGTPDPDCTRSATYTFGTRSFTVSPCLEGPPRPGACNSANLGSVNSFAHFPKCVGGPRNGQPCNPAQPLADECGAAATACQSRGFYGNVTLAQPPCNSVPVLTRTAGTWDNGGAGLATVLRFDAHGEKDTGGTLIDSVNYGAGCANTAGDGKPDCWGCDATPCTEDDPPPYYTTTLPFFLTTGTASTTIFDANMEQSSTCPTFPGKISSQQVGFAQTAYCQSDPSVGSVPVNGCANLSQNNPNGYEMVATFGSLDSTVYGDGAVSMRLRLRDPLAP